MDQVLTYKTSDGFYGIPLGPDLVLGISGTMTGSTQYTGGRVDGSATLSDSGLTVNQTYPEPLCLWGAPTPLPVRVLRP